MNSNYNVIKMFNGFYTVTSYKNITIYTTPKNVTPIDFEKLNRADWNSFEIELTVINDYKVFIEFNHKDGFHKEWININVLGNFVSYNPPYT